jgi:acyl carrier protein
MKIDPKLLSVIAEFFNKPVNEISESSSKDNIDDWDSLEHLKLVLEIESKFKVRFSLEVIPQITSLKSIQEELDKLTNG